MAKKKTIIEETIPDGETTGAETFTLADTDDAELLLEKVKTQYGGSRVNVKVYKILAGHKPIYQFESDHMVTEARLQLNGGGLYELRFFVDGLHKHTEEIEVADKPVDHSQPTNPADIQIQMLREQSQMNRDLLMAVLGRGQNSTPMSEIATIWGLIHGTNGGGGTSEKMIEMFTKGMELGAGRSGELDWKTALIQTAKEIIPPAMQVVAATKGVPMPQIQPNPAAQQQLPPDAVLKTGIDFLKTKILAGLPVGLALDWVVANAADYQQFLAVATSKTFEDFVKIDNDLANEPFNTWVRQFLTGLKEHFKEVNETEDEHGEE